MSTTWWGTKQNPTERMKHEIVMMKKIFNTKQTTLYKQPVRWDCDFVIATSDLSLTAIEGLEPYWDAYFNMINIPKRKNGKTPAFDNPMKVHHLRIAYVSGFPSNEPYVSVPSVTITERTPHYFSKDRICVHNHKNTRTGWDPGKSTGASMAIWSVQWIRAFYYWERTQKWPDETA